ncbi:MAG: hypothetical protein L3J95_02685 [Thermoplasmata archaeon]|nr:hypothetical protein [Thermoplasmata archaeon]MCI4359314.1 hypothetical protein [Thermoplasmata archaeon]
MAKRPFLRSAATSFGILSILAVVALAIFVLLSVYSVVQLRPGSVSSSHSSVAPGAANSVVFRTNVSVNNPGYFALDGLRISTLVRMPGTDGVVIATGSSPEVSIAGGHQGEVPIELTVPISSQVDGILLTHDMQLPGWAWVNATYAGVYSIGLILPRNISWGAPFANLSVVSGTPSLQMNGTVAVPLTVSFSDDSSFAVGGVIRYQVQDSAGQPCTSGAFPVTANSHTSFQGGTVVYLPPSCQGPGSSIAVSFQGGPWNVPLLTRSFG